MWTRTLIVIAGSLVTGTPAMAQNAAPTKPPETNLQTASDPKPDGKPEVTPDAKRETTPDAKRETTPEPFAAARDAANWLATYYTHADPTRVPEAYRTLVREHRQSDKPIGWGMMGTLAGIMLRHPDLIRPWHEALKDLPLKDRLAFLQSAWLSRHDEATALIREQLASAADGMDAEKEFLQGLLDRKAFDPVEPPLRSINHMQVLWGHFYATGEERWVVKVIEGLPAREGMSDEEEMFWNALASSVATHAFEHSRVLEICRAQMKTQPEAVTAVLGQVIASVDREREEQAAKAKDQKPAPPALPPEPQAAPAPSGAKPDEPAAPAKP